MWRWMKADCRRGDVVDRAALGVQQQDARAAAAWRASITLITLRALAAPNVFAM